MNCNSLMVYWTLYKNTWKFSRGWRGRLVLDFFLRVFAITVILITPLIIASVFNTIQAEGVTNENIQSILWSLAVIPGLTVLFWTIHGPSRIIEQQLAYVTKVQYRTWMLEETLKMPLQWHNEQQSGDIYDKIEKGSQALYDFVSQIFRYVDTILRFVITYVIVSFFNIHAAYIIPIGFIIVFAAIKFFDKTLIPAFKQFNKDENKISAKIFDSFTNITTIVILGIRKEVLKIIKKEQEHPTPIIKKMSLFNETKWFTTAILNDIILFGILIVYILVEFNTKGFILVGTFYLVFNYLQRISRSFSNFTGEYGEMVRYCTWLSNASIVSNQFQSETKVQKRNTQIETITLNNLKFNYPNSKNEISIPHITLIQGEKIAFVGESGSGKTTLLKILKGLYVPQQYELQINGKETPIETLTATSSLIPQEPEIFSGTITHNITIGLKHPQKKIIEFAKMAAFHKVVQKLPQKYDSHINEKGVNLSGGEKQRLALARGLLFGESKDMLLFDEPTSSVDPKNEREIYENVFKLFKKKIIISSIHKLNLLPLFDQIYYFENGQIIAHGPLPEILKNKSFKEYYKKHEN